MKKWLLSLNNIVLLNSEDAFLSISFTRVFEELFIVKAVEHSYKSIFSFFFTLQHFIFLTTLIFSEEIVWFFFLIISIYSSHTKRLWSSHQRKNMNSEKSDSKMRSDCMKTRNTNAARKFMIQSLRNQQCCFQKTFRTNFFYHSQEQLLLSNEVSISISIMTVAQDSCRMN